MLGKLKKVVSLVFIVSLVIGNTVYAADDRVDGSYLTHEEQSVGEMIAPRGKYLMSGDSSIGKVGTGLIAAGGTTTANTTVSTVKVSVMVEKYLGGQWLSYTSWTATRNNASYVSTSKNVTVPTGYYYRVRCIHSANTDSSSSQTNGLYI